MAAFTHGLLFFVTEPVPSLQVMIGELKHYSSIYNLKIRSEMGIVLPLTVKSWGGRKVPVQSHQIIYSIFGLKHPRQIKANIHTKFQPLNEILELTLVGFLFHLLPMSQKRYKRSLIPHMLNAVRAGMPSLWKSHHFGHKKHGGGKAWKVVRLDKVQERKYLTISDQNPFIC